MSINIEFRDVDKFVSELGGTLLVVTDSWIIKCNVHSVNIIHQRDAVLKLGLEVKHLTRDDKFFFLQCLIS